MVKTKRKTAAPVRHTRGPWSRAQDKGPVYIVGGPESAWRKVATIADMEHDQRESTANARLIEAAPDLLEACEMLAARMESSGEAWMSDKAWQVAAAAIAKAKGSAA